MTKAPASTAAANTTRRFMGGTPKAKQMGIGTGNLPVRLMVQIRRPPSLLRSLGTAAALDLRQAGA